MDKLSGLADFVQAAEKSSFVAAGRVLGISASAVGKNVARLEQRLGVRLFQRTTRRVQLTEAGQLFYERCRRILDEVQDAEAMLSHVMEAPRGRLRISLPTIGYRFLLPVLPEFMQRYPEIELDLDFNDRIVDVVGEGLDAVIRSGALPDSQLRARRLGPFSFVMCAAPSYLERHGVPRGPADLEKHCCLRFRFPTTGKLMEWVLQQDPSAPEPRLPESFVCNNMEALLAAAIGGMGIAYMPDFLPTRALAEGSLRQVLPQHALRHGHFWVLWPSNRQLSPKLRVFIDFICARLFSEGPADLIPPKENRK